MNAGQWKATIIGVVSNPDGAQLDSLAHQLAESDDAKTYLRHNGDGIIGQSIKDAVRLVPADGE